MQKAVAACMASNELCADALLPAAQEHSELPQVCKKITVLQSRAECARKPFDGDIFLLQKAVLLLVDLGQPNKLFAILTHQIRVCGYM